jgi:hypothetical protein
MTTTTKTSPEQTDAIDKLRVMFPAGSTVHLILRHSSSSTKYISVLHVEPDLTISDVSYLVARAGVGVWDRSNHLGVRLRGTGLDLGTHLVYSLSSVLGHELHKRWVE